MVKNVISHASILKEIELLFEKEHCIRVMLFNSIISRMDFVRNAIIRVILTGDLDLIMIVSNCLLYEKAQ